MTTLYISPNSPFASIGGVERYLMNMIRHANNTLSDTVVILPSFDEDKVERQGAVTFYFSKSLRVAKNSSVSAKRAKVFAELVTKVLADHAIDVIVAENFHLGLPAAYSLQLNTVAAMSDTPVVLRLHSFSATDLQAELVSQLMWSRVSCVSRSVAGDCFRKGADIATLETDYLGVDTEEFTPDVDTQWLKQELALAPESRVVLTASRIILDTSNILREKGIISTIRAFAKLTPRFPDLQLAIAVGRAPANLQESFDHALEMLHGYLKLHGVEKKTTVRAFELDEMPRVYAGADVFVLASENETFGQVFIEAMACGTPVIGTNVGGIPEIISDLRNGYLVPAYNPTVLAHQIESLVTDSDVRATFRRRGLKAVRERFDASVQFALFDDELKEITSKA